MAKLPRNLSGREVVRALGRLGFSLVRQKGSHAVLKKVMSTGVIGCVVPMHDELAPGTLAGVLRQAKVSLAELLENL
jgi:predicted RNA binding protein YcfA (HicA-like mRNA interferase family)